MAIGCGEFKIQYSFDNIQSFEDGDNIPILRGLPQNAQK
jgi:hypothetical protein